MSLARVAYVNRGVRPQVGLDGFGHFGIAVRTKSKVDHAGNSVRLAGSMVSDIIVKNAPDGFKCFRVLRCTKDRDGDGFQQ